MALGVVVRNLLALVRTAFLEFYRAVRTRRLAASPSLRTWDGHPILSDAQLLHPHTDFAHKHWAEVLRCSPAPRVVVDATCGNGHDSLVLANALAAAGGGTLMLCDIQQQAIERSQVRMQAACGINNVEVSWHHCDHSTLLDTLEEATVCLVVFNLGYLPGSDKTIVTTADSTLRALAAAEKTVKPGGTISATLYPGHEEGRREEQVVLDHARELDLGRWSVYYTQVGVARSP